MSYEDLLEKAYEKLPKMKEQEERFEIPKVEAVIEGNRTNFRNFIQVSQLLRREPKHLLKYLTKGLAAPGSVDGQRAIFQSKIFTKTIQVKLNSYVRDYVVCKECERPDTKLIKEDRITFMKCEACGAKVEASEKALDAICDLSNGDIRKAINILQMASTNTDKIDEKIIYEISSAATPSEIKKMLTRALRGKFADARKLLVELLLVRGISGNDVIKQISSQIYDLDVTEKAKIHLTEKVGEFEFRLNQGSNEQVQLEALLAQFALFK